MEKVIKNQYVANTCSKFGYFYRNPLKTLSPKFQWCKKLLFVYWWDELGLKPTRKMFTNNYIKYNGTEVGSTDDYMWNSMVNANYIKYNRKDKCYHITETGIKVCNLIKDNFELENSYNVFSKRQYQNYRL